MQALDPYGVLQVSAKVRSSSAPRGLRARQGFPPARYCVSKPLVARACLAAGEVRNARRNVGRATVIGTAGAALVYLLGTLSVFGTVAHDRLVTSTAPFSDAVNTMFGGSWAWAPRAARAPQARTRMSRRVVT